MTASNVNQETAFVLNGDRVSIRLEIDHGRNRPESVYVGFTGSWNGGAGQCDSSIRDAMESAGEAIPPLAVVLDAWRDLHLKPVASLTAEQVAQLDAARAAMVELEGGRYGERATFDDVGGADFSNTDDTIDSRDVIKRIEELESAFEAAGLNPDSVHDMEAADIPGDADSVWEAADELRILRALESEGSAYAADWGHGEQLIRDSYFEDYAREFAEDVGAVNDDAAWPNNCIDWKKAARELQMDYTSVEFDGVTYWIR